MTERFLVAALYQFVRLDDYQARREPLLEVCRNNDVMGTLLLAREIVARGDTAEVLSDDNLRRARQIAEGRGGEHAPICHADEGPE